MSKAKAIAILRLLQGCNSLQKLKKIHAHVITNGLHSHLAISNKLINFCAVSVSGSLSHALLVFHQIQNPDTESCNSLIRGFSLGQSPLQAILLYNQMLSSPDTFTFSFTLKACERLQALHKCQELHGSVLKSGFERDVIVCTSLLRCYAANGLVGVARLVFDDMSERDLVCWNSMISCYCQANLHLQALQVYGRMRSENVSVDGFTLVGLLSCCAHLGAFNLGVSLHGIASERGFLRSNVYVGNALIAISCLCSFPSNFLGLGLQVSTY